MASIDQRVVELKFNAKNFQSGIKAALASLDNLKKSLNLNKAANEFNKVEKASKKVNFNDLYTSVDSISNRFSTFGIVAMSALNQITTTAMQTGKRLFSALTAPLIEGGKRRALNIEQAKFQIEGLGYTWEQVEGSINYGVKDTAYGLDAAAKACSQLLASQVSLGKEMDSSLRAISGVAAMTGSEYEDIANIFTTVAGNGRLMGDQLLQLSTRGLNAAATLGQYLGKSEAEVREMVSKGQIDFQTFANAMDSAFGEHAKEANKTFTGSLSNMKAALARIGAEFASPAYENLRDFFNSLTPVIDGVKEALKPLVETAKAGMKYLTDFATKTLDSFGGKEGVKGKLTPVIERLNKIVQAMGSLFVGIARTINGVVSPIISAFAQVLGGTLIDSIAGAIGILAKFVNSIAFTDRMTENLKKTFVGIFTVVNTLFKIISKVVSVVSDVLLSAFSATFGFVLDVIFAITGHIGDLIVRVQQFIDDLLALKTVQDLLSTISNLFQTIRSTIGRVYSAFRNLVGIIIDSAFNSAVWVFDKIANAILAIARFVDRAITKLREFIAWVRQLPAVQRFVTNLKDTFEFVKNNIGESASILKGKFISAFNAAKQTIGNFITKLKELISQYIELPSLQDVIAGVLEFMTGLFEKAIEMFHKASEVLGNIFDRVKDLSQISLEGIINNFNNLKNKMIEVINVSGKMAFLRDIFGTIKDGAVGAAQGTASTLELIKAKLLQFVEWVKGKFSQLTMGDVMAAGIGGTFIVFLIQLTKWIKTVDSLTGSFKDAVGTFKKIGSSINSAIASFEAINKAKANAIRMDAISNLIKSIVLLAGAVALLATMDPNRVLVAAGVILVLAGGLIGLSTAMNTISSKTNPEVVAKTATQMIAASGSILILAAALKLLSDIPVDRLVASLIAITFLMGEVMGFMIIMGKFAPEAALESTSMLVVAGSLLILARAMVMIGSIRAGDIIKSVVVITVLMTALGVMFKISKKVKMSKHAAAGILAVSISLMLIARSLSALGKMDSGVALAGISRMMIIMGGFALLMLSMKVAGKHAASAGAAIMFISIAMNIMVLAIKNMASIDKGSLKRATIVINEMLKVFAFITLMTMFSGENAVKAGGSIMMMAGAIVIISGAMILLSKLSDEEIARSTKVVMSILGMFAIVVAATGLSRSCAKTMQQITICLGILVGAVAVLSLIEPKNIISASTAISMILATFALVAASTGKVSKGAMAAIWQLVGVVGAISILLAVLAQLDGANTLAASTAISSMLAVIGGLVLLTSAFNIKVNLGAVAEIAGAIDLVILIIGALVVAVGALSTYIPELEEFLDNGIVVLNKIGQAIGEFLGGIVSGYLSSASEGLVTLGENLSRFMEALQPFIQTVSSIDDRVIDGAVKLTEMMLLFAGADLLNSIAFWSDGQGAVDAMVEGLPKLGEAMAIFSATLSDGVNLDALATGAEAAKSIAEIATMLSEGGLADAIFGSSGEGLQALAENLPHLGEALVNYGNSVEGLKSDAISASIEPLRSLVEISNMINGEAGKGFSLVSLFSGSNAQGLWELGENLPHLGEALTNYGNSVSNLNADAINSSIAPLKSLVEISNMINGEAGNGFSLVSLFSGSNAQGLWELGENLPHLGEALTNYGNSLTDLKADAINASIEPLRSLVEISNMINGEAGRGFSLISVFSGSNAQGLWELGENLPHLGEALTNYGNSLTDLNAGAITASIEPLRSLVEISNMIDKEGGAGGFFGGSASEAINSFKENLPSLGSALRDYSYNVTDLNAEAVHISVDCLRSLMDAFNSANEGISSLFGGSTSGGITTLKENLPALGEALRDYSNNVTDLSAEAINVSVESLKKIIEVVGTGAEYSEGLRTLGFALKDFGEAFSNFTQSLDGLNYAVIDIAIDYLNRIRDAMLNFGGQMPDISGMLQGFVSSLQQAATMAVQGFVMSFITGGPAAAAAAVAMVEFALNQMVSRLNRANADFLNRGKTLMLKFAQGIRAGGSSVLSALDSVLSAMISRVSSYSNSLYSVGANLMAGLRNGMNDNSAGPINAAWDIGRRLIQKMEQATGVNSPSKFTAAIGRFFDMGLVVGIVDYAGRVLRAVGDLGDDMVDEATSIAEDISFLDDLDPVITPRIDMSDVDKGISKMNSGFAGVGAIPVNMQGRYMSSAFRSMSSKSLEDAANQNGIPSQVINNYDLTQNNYSPKALSRVDIYRDTKNQFSRLKGVVNA